MILAHITGLIGALTIITIITWSIIEESARDKKTDLAFKYARRHGLMADLEFCDISRFNLILISNGNKTKYYNGYTSLSSIIRGIRNDFIEQD